MTNPVVRLALRALVAGLLAFISSIQAAEAYTGEAWITAALYGIGAAAVLASAELATPLNNTVGVGKDAPAGGVGK